MSKYIICAFIFILINESSAQQLAPNYIFLNKSVEWKSAKKDSTSENDPKENASLKIPILIGLASGMLVMKTFGEKKVYGPENFLKFFIGFAVGFIVANIVQENFIMERPNSLFPFCSSHSFRNPSINTIRGDYFPNYLLRCEFNL